MSKTESIYFKTGMGRFSFPTLIVPTKNQRGEDQWKTDFLITKESWKEQGPIVAKNILLAANTFFKANFQSLKEVKDNDIIVPLLDMDNPGVNQKGKAIVTPDDQKGYIRIRSANKNKPSVWGPDGSKWDDSKTSTIKGGHWGMLVLNPFGYDYLGNKGVSLGLAGVQYVKPDTQFGFDQSARAAQYIESIEVPVNSNLEGFDTSSIDSGLSVV